MTDPITPTEISRLLSKNFNLDLPVPPYYYTQITHLNRTLIFCSTKKPHEAVKLPKGSLIMEISDNKVFLLGSFLNIVDGYPTLTVEILEKIKEVTHGNSITIDSSDGWYLLIDKYKRRIALGKITSKIFTPICDRGNFLRYES